MTDIRVGFFALIGIFAIACSQSGPTKDASNRSQRNGEGAASSRTSTEALAQAERPKPEKGTTMKTHSCASALKALAELTLDDWGGLPSDCSKEAVKKQFEPTAKEGAFVLGSKRSRAAFEYLKFPTGDEPLKLWTVESKVAMLELAYPELKVKELVGKLGEPDAKLEFAWDVLTLKGEWVWPRRGLTILVNPENLQPLGLVVYPPTTVEAYVENLQLDRSVREQP